MFERTAILRELPPGTPFRYGDPDKDLDHQGRTHPHQVYEFDARAPVPITVFVPRKPVLYLAHPVSGDMRGNARRAIDWIRWFHERHPEVIVVAPWVAEVLAFADSKPDAAGPCATCPGNFERVIPDDEEIVRHLDGVVMVGGRVSPGMARERDAALAAGLCVINMTHYVRPEDVEPDHELEVL